MVGVGELLIGGGVLGSGVVAAPRAATGWPDASNTGVPAGVTLTSSGGFTVSTPGTTVDAFDITGNLTIDAANVTVKRCRITNTGNPMDTTANATGLVVEDCELDGNDTNSTALGLDFGITIRRVNVYGVENGFNAGNGGGTLLDSYVHDLYTGGGAHTDGVQFTDDAEDILIQHCNMVAGSGWTSCVNIYNELGAIQNHNVTVYNNRLIGTLASYALYAPRQSGCYLNGIYINSNRFMGAVDSVIEGDTVTEFNDNVYDDTGLPYP